MGVLYCQLHLGTRLEVSPAPASHQPLAVKDLPSLWVGVAIGL